MRNRTLLGVAFGLTVLLVAGGLWASNTGFKLNYPLTAADGTTSKNGQQSIALPYNQQTDLLNAFDLITDIEAGNSALVDFVARFNRQTDGFVTYDGGSGSAFLLVPGEAYLVRVTADTNYVVVGSHAPALGLDLIAADAGATSKNGQNFFSYPYHSTAANAFDLITEIETFAGGDVVDFIARFNAATDGFVTYDGSSGTAFTLNPGQGYIIRVTADVLGWEPSHF